MKKVLFLGNLHSGGAEHQMVVIACLLKRDGYDVTYLTSDQSTFFQKDLEEAGIPLVRIPENKLASLLKLNIPRSFIKLLFFIKKNKFDTIVSFLAEWNFYNCVTANWKSTRHKAITGIRNNRTEVFTRKSERFYGYFECYVFRKVSNSDAARLKYAEYYPHVADKLMTIYNIVDLPNISSLYSCRKDERVHIIVPAAYRAVKNPMGLLCAVARLNKEDLNHIHIDWYGSIEGGKERYDEMASYIRQQGLEDTVALHDATNDIANRINEADMVGLFSSSEGLPNAICEGMMIGKPVIMTRVSDYDVLVDKSNGFLCDWNDTDSIISALEKTSKLTDDDLIKMGQSSKRKAETLFSEKNVLSKWKQII